MLQFTIKLTILLCWSFTFAQQQTAVNKNTQKDSISYKTNYGLRIGIDISKPVKKVFDNDYGGLEIVGDYRITKRWYLATELGYENQITKEDYTTSTASGSYIRAGANFNTYNNWLNMNNEIFIGGRYGFSLFNQSLNSYTPNVNTSYFPSKELELQNNDTQLTAHWVEIQLGIKAETFKNLFLGFHVSYKSALSVSDPENFKTLYIPGFNRLYATNTGFGFNYTISYLIPFQKK